MFLTRRFFLLLALVAATSVMGYWQMWLYPVARVMLAVLAALVVVDFVLLWTLGRVTAERTCQEKFCLDRDNGVSIRVQSLTFLPLTLTVSDELPPAFRYHRAIFRFRLRPRGEKEVTYSLHPTERGSYDFGAVLLFLSSPLGLVERKRKSGHPQSVKVYPAFRHLDRLELAAVTENAEYGSKRIRRAGAQTDFDQIKDYVRGDDFRRINWKATARARRLLVNVYQDEKAQPVICVIDKGRAMQRTWSNMTLLDYAINSSLALSYVALRHDDMAGLITFSAHVETHLPPSRRTTQLPLILENLYAETSRYEEADFGALSTHVGRAIHRRSLLVLYTDFSTLDALERQLPHLRLLARSHCLLVVFFRDEEVEAVAAQAPRRLPDYVLQTMTGAFTQEKRAICSRLASFGIFSLLTTPHHLPVDVIRKYLELKQRGAI